MEQCRAASGSAVQQYITDNLVGGFFFLPHHGALYILTIKQKKTNPAYLKKRHNA
jgi:hypothetical protein